MKNKDFKNNTQIKEFENITKLLTKKDFLNSKPLETLDYNNNSKLSSNHFY